MITLDRPKALHALTTPMLRSMMQALETWTEDPGIGLVLVLGSGDRGLCAGGDLRSMRASALAGGGEAREFFRLEYQVNARISRYPKPYIAIMDGITMGGGIGISAHGSLRIVTERSTLAMPEVAIGLVPDVGGTRLLALAPGELGTYVALCAARFGAADAIALGLADVTLRSEDLEEVINDVITTGTVEPIIGAAVDPGESDLEADRAWIDECFSPHMIGEIFDLLHTRGTPGALMAANTMRGHSPSALAVTLASLRKARSDLSLEQTLEREFRVSCACVEHPDLAEGIRAMIIDKDHQPRWNPSEHSEVDTFLMDSYFTDRGYGCLGLQESGAEPASSQ